MSKPVARYFGPAENAQFLHVPGQRLLLWDKDSTLADTLHRQPMIEQIKAGTATWVDYSLAAAADGIIEGSVALFRLMSKSWHTYQMIVSGANSEAEPQVRAWGRRHQIPYDGLILRAPGNRMPNAKYKIAVIAELRSMGMDPALFVEDWPEAAAEIQAETGVPVLVVNPCYPPETAAEIKELGSAGIEAAI